MGAMGRVFAGMRYLARQDTPGRRLMVQEDDTFLVSYPKSGNTWVRLLVANLIHPEEAVTLLSADRIIPFVDDQTRKYFGQMARPRVIKSHYPFCETYKRVVYVVRDPRDVAVSQYYFQIKRRVLNDGFPIDQFITKFVAGTVCRYGSWGENVASWLGARSSDPDFLLVRYEDLLLRTHAELGRIANLLQIAATSQRLDQAVERSTAKRMRELEKQEGSMWASTRDTRQDMPFIRAATNDQWRTVLPPVSVERIEAAWSGLMQILGYELACVPAERRERSGDFTGWPFGLSITRMRAGGIPAQAAT